jgi:N-formylglutamate amidohydrolase
MRNELKLKCELDEYHRWYEEDPHTGQFIESMPITLIANDSRFEYDLNRKPEDCIYEEAWGKKIWKKKLNPKDRQIALKKHSNFYRVLKALVERINKQFSTCVVYDIHSYNHQRWEREVPLFNIGTERLDQEKFGSYINLWQEELSKIKVSGIENKCSINDVFHGRGYALEFITHHFPQVLVLATEIKKFIAMN